MPVQTAVGGSHELPETDRIHLKEIDFANREGIVAFINRHAEQRTSGNDVIFGCVFTEIFQRIQGVFAFLDLIE